MPQIKNLREKPKEFEKDLKKRFADSKQFREGLRVYEDFRKLKKQMDDLRQERNRKTREFAETKNKKIILEVKKLKKTLSKKEAQFREVEEKLRQIELTLPNWVHGSVPVGKTDADNEAVKYKGIPVVVAGKEGEFKQLFPKVKYKTTGDEMLHHADLVEVFGLADIETASKISGARFYIEKNQLAMLDLALGMHVMKSFADMGFMPVVPPYLMKKDVEEKITYFTSFEESIYELKDTDLILITTSEHPLAAMYQDTVFEPEELPVRLVAFSPAFRKEAGSHGKDTKGIFRAHHFNKVELHSIVAPGKDLEELEFLLEAVEKIMKPLGFPYRIVKNSSGDMDNRAVLQYDLEAWFPAQNRFRELHSLATVGSWISEKLNTKLRTGEGNEVVTNLYATGAAVQRTLLAIFVNNYDAKKQVIHVPKVLQGLSGVREIKVHKK